MWSWRLHKASLMVESLLNMTIAEFKGIMASAEVLNLDWTLESFGKL